MKSLRFALLGQDSLFQPLLEQLPSSPHELVWMVEEGPNDSPAEPSAAGPATTGPFRPLLPRRGAWEELLHGDVADVVLVGRGEATLREDQLRRLVQAGIPTVVAHPGSLAPLFCYELDMIRRESKGLLIPYYPGVDHLQVRSLAELVRRSRLEAAGYVNLLGEIEQITIERMMPQRDQAAVLDQLARDIDLLISIAGIQTKVSALGTGEGERAYAGLSVQLTGSEGIVTRWNVSQVSEQTTGRVTVSGTQGQIQLEMPPEVDHWSLKVTDPHGNAFSSEQLPEIADAELAESSTLELIASAISSESSESNVPDSLEDRWFQACQSIDLLDAVQRSLVKGRTIELHFEDYTSEATFKGRMAATGCAVLMLGLLTCVYGFISDSLSGIYKDVMGKNLPPISRWWPWALLLFLCVFLFIQVLPKFFPERPKSEDSGT